MGWLLVKANKPCVYFLSMEYLLWSKMLIFSYPLRPRLSLISPSHITHTSPTPLQDPTRLGNLFRDSFNVTPREHVEVVPLRLQDRHDEAGTIPIPP
ncbi:hypothetical protein CH063_06270 [Colletotrichum higginsianum]|uniref:Uncharacterized protein n=1 Tax=Colletotrichum higginsianum (strain IMI 349063) TaxID=759273 RepID=H1V1Y9_COLHI|nr:hypothetical protein CH063_06270 [Colletotrichum higginsianum]